MTIAVFSSRVRKGGFGLVMAASGAGIERATGWRPAQPLNGQRCLTRAAFEAGLPLAAGWGAETGLTIDLLRKGLRVAEVEVPLAHRATGNDWRSQVHRARQLAGVALALAAREPATQRARRGGAGRPPRAGRPLIRPRRAVLGRAGLAAGALSAALTFAVAVAGPSLMEPALPGRPGQPPWSLAAHPVAAGSSWP